MKLNGNEVYLFNPDYIMQNDMTRILLFSRKRSNHLSVPRWGSFLHPVHAKIFSFFTFDRQLRSTLSLLCNYLKRDEAAVHRIISPFIENPMPVYTKYNDEKVYIPQNVIVKRNQISGKVDFLNINPRAFDCHTIDIHTRRINKGPQLLTFMLNNSCTTNCIYCYADKKTRFKKNLSTLRIMGLIDEAITLPVRLINLMGGEIFLHPDWAVILKKLVDCDLSPDYISTKCPLTEQIIRSIQETGFRNPIQLSLDSCSAEVLKKTLSVNSDYLPNVLKGIKLLDDSGLNYRINTVLTTWNIQKDEFLKLFGFLSGLKNISDWRITPAVNSNWIDYDVFRKLKPKKQDIESLYAFIEKEIVPYSTMPVLLNRSAINLQFKYCSTGSKDFNGVDCSALNNHLFVLPDGKATICEQLYWSPQFIMGDVSESSIAEVWNSPVAAKLANLERDAIQHSSPCKTCTLFESCFREQNRCWVDIVKAYGKENWDYPDPRCIYAPSMIHNLAFE